jgi:hypothetical protein
MIPQTLVKFGRARMRALNSRPLETMKRHCLVFPKVMFSNSSQSGDELPLGRDVIYSRNVQLWTIWEFKVM